ncbi:hypothetical protein NDU88_004700 [Pleurodeles waltl]|uniref:Uncharacterized protein n=1 Tax=Pleurodeles waltl TaxID=8319 RepID=A0AAV7W998_PLEWA|nr:hypothetical protein NDU88_004700 [Pleurodeles waltl]
MTAASQCNMKVRSITIPWLTRVVILHSFMHVCVFPENSGNNDRCFTVQHESEINHHSVAHKGVRSRSAGCSASQVLVTTSEFTTKVVIPPSFMHVCVFPENSGNNDRCLTVQHERLQESDGYSLFLMSAIITGDSAYGAEDHLSKASPAWTRSNQSKPM